jgi:hypothetical protein
MALKLSATAQYQAAFQSLEQLKNSGIERDRLKPIALYLLYSAESEVPAKMFPYVGEGDVRDRAITRAFEQAWQEFQTEGDDELLY